MQSRMIRVKYRGFAPQATGRWDRVIRTDPRFTQHQPA